MAKVRIKCKDPDKNDRNKKQKLLEILCRNQIEITNAPPTNDGYIVFLRYEEQADNIFSTDVKKALTDNDFQPILPPELKVKKSVIASNLDDEIYDNSEDEIKEELIAQNHWLDDIDSVYKFPKSNTIKITFTQTALARKSIESGLLAFSLSIAQHQIRQETFIPIKCCFKCYQLEDHLTKNCNKDKNYKICSECGLEGHVWHQCREKKKRCINCQGDHSTLAMRCIKRKKIMKEKRREEAERNRLGYAGITTVNTTQPQHSQPQMPINLQPTITREDMLKINICIAHAHRQDLLKPGSYEKELEQTLLLNELPTIKIPKTSQTSKTDTTQPKQHHTQAAEAAPPNVKPRKSKDSKESANTKENEVNDEIEQELGDMEEELLTIKAKDIGLEIYTPEDKGWPENFTHQDLVNGLHNNRFKYTYKDERYKENEIIEMIAKGKIDLHHCWNIIGRDMFRKIRTGIDKERSPIETRQTRRQNTNNIQ